MADPEEIRTPERAAAKIHAANMMISDAYVQITEVHIWIMKMRMFQEQMGNTGSREGEIVQMAELQSIAIDQPMLDLMSQLGKLEEILTLFGPAGT